MRNNNLENTRDKRSDVSDAIDFVVVFIPFLSFSFVFFRFLVGNKIVLSNTCFCCFASILVYYFCAALVSHMRPEWMDQVLSPLTTVSHTLESAQVGR